MIINREMLLSKLLTIQPGVSKKNIVEQSSCVVFLDNMLITYNDEIACFAPFKCDLMGAVQYDPLVSILSKMPEETLEASTTAHTLILKGKGGRKASIRMDVEVLLGVGEVEAPKKWHDLDEAFSDAIRIVQPCCGTDENAWILTNFHITPKYVEATDSVQAARYDIDMPVKANLLVSGVAIRHVIDMGMCHISETPNWLHFKNDAGLVMSMKRAVSSDDFPDLSPFLNQDGVAVKLPKGLVAAAERAAIFTAEDSENTDVLIELIPDKVKITGTGVNGKYVEPKKMEYDGVPCAFMINPEQLIKLVKTYSECSVSDRVIKVDGGRYVYITSLDQPKPADGMPQPEDTKKKPKKKKAAKPPADEADDVF